MQIRLSRKARARSTALAAALALSAAGIIAPAASAGPNANNNTSKKLRAAVTAEEILEHLREFQEIADANGGTRVSGLPGYDASKDYAVEVFRNAGYDVTVQDFTFNTFIEKGPTVFRQVAPGTPRDLPVRIMSYSGSGDETANASVPSGAAIGCAPGDFGAANAGTIVLVSRGTCSFAAKANNALAVGAAGVVVYNNAAGELNGTLGDAFTGDIPVVGATQALGLELVGLVPDGLRLQLATSTFRGEATTYNVLAESRWGDPDNVVMAGAHLDSVAAGPGINDNGSGAGAILEVAEQMAKVKPKNQVRFALWGAEESGLLGAHHYIDTLPESERAKIALYLNFDMVASPNYVRFIYDGDNSAFPVGTGSAEGPKGSGQIEQLFTDYFGSVSQASAETPFSGRSDYGPFIAVGIPAGGLFTGAEGIKTQAQADIFGGVAGAAYDPCYHQACDTLRQSFAADDPRAGIYAQLEDEYRMVGNVNLDALEEMSDAVAHAVLTYAFDTRTVNGKGKGHPVSPPGQATPGQSGGAGTGSGGGLHDDHDHEEPVAS